MPADGSSPDIAQSDLKPRQDYNRVLEHYVEDQNGEIDLVGLIAYALYKRQKRDWIVQYRLQKNGQRPSEVEIAAVTGSYLNDDVKQTLRNRASDLLSSYADTYVEALEPGIRLNALSNENLRQAREIEQSIKSQSGLWSQVVSGLVATAIWTLLVTALVLAGSIYGSDIIDAWRSRSAPISTTK